MHFAPRRPILRSLRFQLAFWNTAAILALILATLVGLRQGLRSFLQRELDMLLKEDLAEVQLILKQRNLQAAREALDRKAVSHKARSWFVRILRPDGTVALATTGAPEILLVDEMPAGPTSAEDFRLVQALVNEPEYGLLVRVGCSEDFVNDDVNTLTRFLVVAALAFVVVAPVSGWWLAGRATQPLATIANTAARVRPGNLDERVPLRGSGDELDQLAATLNGLLDRLAEHLERQRTFIANAAHELRSPLAALRTLAEITLGQDRSPDNYRESLADIVEACDGLSVLVNQLLLLAEGEAGLIRAAGAVDLPRVAARVVDMFQGIAETREVQLTLEASEPVFVAGSETHLRQVLSNLIDNALKFTPAGGAVTVRIGWGPHNTGVMQVSDTGAGIAADDLPHVFERFYRADRARQRESSGGGFGLGLSICEALVRAHEGQIDLQSQPGQGTRVMVTLPAWGAPASGNLTKM